MPKYGTFYFLQWGGASRHLFWVLYCTLHFNIAYSSHVRLRQCLPSTKYGPGSAAQESLISPLSYYTLMSFLFAPWSAVHVPWPDTAAIVLWSRRHHSRELSQSFAKFRSVGPFWKCLLVLSQNLLISGPWLRLKTDANMVIRCDWDACLTNGGL